MSAKRRDAVYDLLADRDWEGILGWYMNERGAVRILMSLLYDQSPLIRWRVVEAFGRVSVELSKSDMESVRQIIRRFFWGMNDESGNLIRNAPESIGEIIFNVPELIEEYGLVLASFQHEEPFECGVHAGLARISVLNPAYLHKISDSLKPSLISPDPSIRAYTFYVFNSLGTEIEDTVLKNMREDRAEFEYYNFDSGYIETVSVSDYISRVPEPYSTNRI